MWSTEIENVLSNQKNFMGCYPEDDLPTLPTKSKSYSRSLIINTKPSNEEGEHWIAIVIHNENCLYFDSFGLPILSIKLIKFLHNFHVASYSDVCIQNVTSNLCGKFCIAFVKYVKCKKSYEKFLAMFDYLNLNRNDKIVEEIYQRIISKKSNLRTKTSFRFGRKMYKAPTSVSVSSSFLSKRKTQHGRGIKRRRRKKQYLKLKKKNKNERKRRRRQKRK